MAKGRKSGGKAFVKGQSGNPNGRPKLPDDVKAAKQINRAEVTRVLNEFLAMTKEQIQDSIRKPETPALQVMFGSIIVKAVTSGDHYRLNFLLDRLIGKVKDELLLEMPIPTVVSYGENRIVMGARMPREDEEKEEG